MDFKRALHFALVNFYRNKQMAIAAIFVLSLVIMVVTAIFFMQGATDYLVGTIKDKIDITAYFKADTIEEQMLGIKQELAQEVPGLKSIQYVSREDALANFNQKHGDNSALSQALKEVGGNPFLPSLNIITNGDALAYEKTATLLQGELYQDVIESVDFYQKKDIIEKVFAITRGINRFGWATAIITILVAILVVFNTTKLIITFAGDEISTMRVMGATNWFIKTPFIIEGALFGLVSFVICFIATALLTYFLSGPILVLVPGFNVFTYFLSHFVVVVFMQLLASVGLGALASLVVVNKYLKV